MDIDSCKIICKDYPPEFILDKNVAKEYFKQFGKLKRVTFKVKLRVCTVEYADHEGYLRALNNAGEYNGVTFTVSSPAESASRPKKKTVNKSEPIWVDKDEIEAELAAMSGEAPKLYKPLEESSPSRDSSKLEKTPKLKKSLWRNETGTRPKKNVKSKDNVNTIVSGEEVELVNLILSQGVTTDDKYRILEARDKLIKLKLKRNPPIKSSATVGTCPDMCPEKERLFREIKHQVAWYEQDDNEKSMNYGKAVKQYSRSSADQEAPLAHELRPVNVLQMTMGYLLHNIIDLCDTDEVHLGEWFHFLWDRTRGIRKDITQQELCSQGAVELVEQCARFHIHCSARLVAEDPSVFDQKINTENLTKCLQTLKYMYHDLSLKGESCRNEAEFRAYIILLNLNDGNFMWEVQQLRREIQRSAEVHFALQVYSAIDKNNYIKFFKLVYSTTYLNACILMRYFNQIRIMAVKTLHKCCLPRAAKTSYPLSELNATLAFDDVDATIDFLQYCGLSVDEETTYVMLDKNDFLLPQFPYILDRSNVVEEKRKNSVGRIICGTDLPPKIYQTHVIQNSFDLKGNLISDILDDLDLEKVRLRLLEELDRSKRDAHTKEEPKSKIVFPYGDKFSDASAFVERVDNPFAFVKKQEKVDNPFAFVKKEEKIDNPFAFAKPEEKVDHSLAKREEKLSNPFAFVQKEPSSSKPGSIFDTTPPTPKNIFASPFSFQTPFGANDPTRTAPSVDQPDFSFAPPQIPSATTGPNPPEAEPNKGGFKFDLVLPPPTTENYNAAFQPAPVPELMVQEAEEDQEQIREELRRKEEEERARILEEQRKLKLKVMEEQKKLELRKKEEQKRLEEKLREERRLKELKKKKQEEELKRRLEEMRREEEELKELEIKIVVKSVITSLVDYVDNKIRREKLVKIKGNIEKRLLLKVFKDWKVSVTVNKRKRKAVDCSPGWINSKTLEQSAQELHTSSQELTLSLMKRYKYGKPLDIGHLLLDEHIKNVNLFELTYSILKNRIYELTVNKPKNIFWKVVVSLPDKNELAVGLNRMEEAMESAFPWTPSKDRRFHLEQIRPNSLESVTYCVEKQQGYDVKEYDANGIIFLAKNFNANLQRRIFQNLRGFGVFTKVPIVIILQEYDASECNLQKLIKENIVSDYVVLVENASASKLVNVVEEGLVFLAKKVESSPPLELDTLKSFMTKYLCSEIWKRANSFGKWNSSYKKCLRNPNVVLSLYNEGLSKLKSIILDESNREYAVFPEEFKKYLNSDDPDYLPCSFRYFPKFWKTQQYLNKLEGILTNLSLPNWSDDWPPPNEYELELSVAEYSSKVTKQPEALFYKTMSLLLRRVDPNVNFSDIGDVLWTDIVALLGLEKLDDVDCSLSNADFNHSIFTDCFVVYNKNVLGEYRFCDWFYVYNPKIKQLVEEDLEKEPFKEVKKKVPGITEHLRATEDVINSLWDTCLSNRPDKSDMVKEMKELAQSLNGLAAEMAVHKRISTKLEEHLSRAIAEK